ncbi:hypothetical protein [Natrinema halophilum]|uniref:hypothetical protein n=1 Tax=Natrinema halophilum TaxID=1699371 RepID=UPI001F3AFEBD|nr:hypothetical protein [Natrinema halophilum]UHQ95981.1 hypothetical protein HYG82_21130 [Natrinema halophilum]
MPMPVANSFRCRSIGPSPADRIDEIAPVSGRESADSGAIAAASDDGFAGRFAELFYTLQGD